MRRAATVLAALGIVALLSAAPASAAFGLKGLEFKASPSAGSSLLLAGSHPSTVETNLELNTEVDSEFSFEILPEQSLKNLDVSIPPGIVGNPTAMPQCSSADFLSFPADCPNSTAIGKVTTLIEQPNQEGNFLSAVYNLKPPPGAAAMIGFSTVIVPYEFVLRVNPHFPYNVIAHLRTVPNVEPVYASKVTLWGVPASPSHDFERGECVGGKFPCEVSLPEKPFITMPTRCGEPLSTSFTAESWQGGTFAETIQSEGVSGCSSLKFTPTVTSRPTTSAAGSASGLDFSLNFNQEGLTSPGGTAQSEIEKAVVTLPAGITTNPSVANGLLACSFAAYESETADSEAGTGCPESSKVGSVEVETPLLEGKLLTGSLYVAEQGGGPFNNLLTIFMVIKDPELGILIKQAGKVDPDPNTGQLTTTFDQLPQLPFSHFRLHFRSGERAPLISPSICGSYTTQAELFPYANPSVPVYQSDSFQITSGADGGPCLPSPAALPNQPRFSAGTMSPIAGAYSPFVLSASRADGSQEFSAISVKLPKGLLGRLAGIPYCSEAQIAQAQARSAEGDGALEVAHPSCLPASEVGTVRVGSGAGSQPLYVNGHAYLAGPYKGAPLSLEIITPAIAGPFDLGTVAVRTALYVDQTSAQITAVSDPLPTIVHGLPLDIRSIALSMNRPDFTLNPTSCAPSSVEGSITSVLGQTAPLAQYFQVDSCGELGFKPSLSLKLSGGTNRTTNPFKHSMALTGVVKYPKGAYANIAKASVILPASEQIDNAHVNNPCTRVQFAAGQCPPTSILGRAKATSPLLSRPLEGPVYFRSNGKAGHLPDIVADLRGQIEVVVVGEVDTVVKKGSGTSRIRTQFNSIPDAPVSRFEIHLFGGKRGLLVNNTNICRAPNRAIAVFEGQNGRSREVRPSAQTECGMRRRLARAFR